MNGSRIISGFEPLHNSLGKRPDHAATGWMPSVPAETQLRIRSGMRWTVWLAALAVPFSYGSKILLARVSPEAIATYGLLLVYIGVVSCVLYFGGDAVAIKFLPELGPEKRLSFLLSYFLVICATMLVWLGLAALFPESLHYLFGPDVGSGFLLSVLILAPIPILFSLIQAVLKANLDFRHAQFLARLITIGSFLVYIFLFLFRRPWLARYAVEIVWFVYLTLTTLGIAAGLRWLRRSPFLRQPGERLRVRFFLPRGFWTFALGTQSISLISLLQRVDFVLVLNFGGMKILGEYVAITALALTIPVVNGYFLQTLLPSLTNLFAADNRQGAGEAFRAHMRLLLLVVAAGTCGLIFLAAPLVAIFGPLYKGLALPVLLLTALVGLASPGSSGGTLLSAVGKPHEGAWVSLFQISLNAGLFLLLWPHFRLLGAVLGLGLSQLAGSILVFLIARLSVPFRTGLLRDWARLAFVILLATAVAWYWRPQSWLAGLAGCVVSSVLFLLVGNYRWSDCRGLWSWVVPSPESVWRKGRDSLAGLGRN